LPGKTSASTSTGFYDQRERYAKPITMVQEGPMLRQLFVGTAVSVCNIAIHALVMATVVQLSSRIARAKGTMWQSLRWTTVMIATASIATVPVLMVAHFSEVMVWSLAYAIVDAAPAGADPVYFAFVNYTTLGYGDVTPVERWRLLGPITAMNGVLLFGWSTAVIFEVLRRTARRGD
jgi:Ion channel